MKRLKHAEDSRELLRRLRRESIELPSAATRESSEPTPE
jgi:hypothetical protein